MDALADAQGLLEQFVQVAADLVGLAGGLVGVAQLPQDLGFAGDHGVEAGGDAEDVGDGVGAVADVAAGGEVEGGPDAFGLAVGGRLREAAPQLAELVHDGGEGAVEAGGGGVDLHAVAGGEHHGLADFAPAQEPLRQTRARLRVHREPVQGLYRGTAMRDADYQEVHFTVPVSWRLSVL